MEPTLPVDTGKIKRARKRKRKRTFKGRGTIRIDRQFAGVGRLALASGLTDPIAFRQVDDLLTSLDRGGRSDILRLVKDRNISPRQLLDLARQRGTGASVAELRLNECLRFQDVLETVRKSMDASSHNSPQHRRNLVNGLQRMLAVQSAEERDSVLVKDLPRLAEDYRRHCDAAGLASEWNHTRAYVRTFMKLARVSTGQMAENVKALDKLPLSKETALGEIDIDLLRILDFLTDNETATIIRTMATAGMGPKEYFYDDWFIEGGDYLLIDGRKRDGRVRRVPLVYAAKKQGTSLTTFRRRFATLQEKLHPGQRFAPYDLRRTFACALDDAEVPVTRHKRYMGHGARNITEHYQKRRRRRITPEEMQALREDAERLKNYFRLDTLPDAPGSFGGPEVGQADGR